MNNEVETTTKSPNRLKTRSSFKLNAQPKRKRSANRTILQHPSQRAVLCLYLHKGDNPTNLSNFASSSDVQRRQSTKSSTSYRDLFQTQPAFERDQSSSYTPPASKRVLCPETTKTKGGYFHARGCRRVAWT